MPRLDGEVGMKQRARSDGYIALAIGVILSIIVGTGLMALLLFSNRRGYDEPPTFTKEE